MSPASRGPRVRFAHFPTPLHGWRAFAGEIGTIVLGVLIALGADEVVQTLHQRAEVRDAEAEIRGELQMNMARMRSRWDTRACVANRVGELQALIDSAAGSSGTIKTPSWVGRPQFWTLQTARWQASSQAGRAAFLPANTVALYATMYTYITNVNAEMTQEQSDWARLRSLEHLKRLTPEMSFELTSTLQDARYINWRMGVWARLLQSLSDQLNLNLVSNNVPASRSACIPMETPRGQAVRESNSAYGDEP